jgi:serine/threonine protein kinase
LSPLAAGTTLCDGRYRLDAVVGRGGMAIVWRATDLQLERDVAIKVIADVLAEDPRFIARFEREARLAAALNHPNLVKLFDYSVVDERPFLVMEYIGGGTLAEAHAQSLDVDTLARDLLDAVAHIHAAGILHRDIKPANVLLDADGAPRLTDFGIARGEETTGLTQTGQVLGTLRYIAPEVAGGEPATVRSDLYALGVLLGELSGTRSEPLERLLPRMTARDQVERPASAQEALADLDPTRILEPTTPTATERRGQTPSPEKPARPAGGLTPFTDETFTSERGQAPRAGSGVSGFRGLTPRSGRGISRGQAAAAAAVLLAVLALVVVAASVRGGDSPAAPRQLGPAPAGAPADQQIDRLERIVRAAPRKP